MNYSEYVKSQIPLEDWKRVQEMGLNLDTRVLAELWPNFVNFHKRSQTETPFLIEHLPEYNKPKVFDAALGSGATTIGLKLAGIEDIVSNELDDDLIRVAQEEGKKFGFAINLTSYDWRSLDGEYSEAFDMVICLGNSLTYLFKKEDQIKVLENFRAILKPNGKLVIDERNYAEHILKGNYRFSGNVVYCGKDKVDAHPIYVSETMVVMEYQHKETREKAHLVLYPFKRNELKSLLEQVGFRSIKAYGDYKLDFRPEEPEFITYVSRK